MKRTVSIIIGMMCVATALLFTACHSNSIDSDETATSEQSQMNESSQIIGSWKAVKDGMRYISDGEIIFESEHEMTEKQIWEFRNDGTFVCYSDVDNGEETGNWSIEEQGIVISRQYSSSLGSKGLVEIIDDRTIQIHFLFSANPEMGVENDGIWTLTLERM